MLSKDKKKERVYQLCNDVCPRTLTRRPLTIKLNEAVEKMPARLRLTLEAPHAGQDNFFLWSMVILPIIAEGAYIFDAWYFLSHYSLLHSYNGLLSTILVVFTYLRYCAPIESHKMLAVYYVILCLLNEVGTIGYIVVYITHNDVYNIVIYFGWAVLELVMTISLIYYRVRRGCLPTFHVESKHLFHFISRLEVILAIFIPFFLNNISITLTKHSIAFFLLFDFFSDSYSRFQGFWIKSVLYLFVCTVTVCVALEWVFSSEHKHVYEVVASGFELISGCLCNLLIIFQFNPYHLTPTGISKIAREGMMIQQANFHGEKTIEVIVDPSPEKEPSRDSIIHLKF